MERSMIAHTAGIMKPGVSKVFGSDAFTAVPDGNESTIVAVFGFCGAPDESESIANAKRFCAVWNALNGIPLNEIESAAQSGSISHALHKVISQRDELLEALEKALPEIDCSTHSGDSAWNFVRAAIAKAPGVSNV
jgi:hypothetical protein